MQLVLILKQLLRHRIWLAIAAVASIGIAGYAVKRLAPSQVQWTANTQVFVDSSQSAIADSNIGLDSLGVRAGVYANMLTSSGVLKFVAQSSSIPADAIAVTGPVSTSGIRAGHSPTAAGPGGPYSLTLDVTDPQPIIRISADAPTRDHALALANGAAQGLTQYVNDLVTTQKIPYARQIDIRQLGQPTVNPAQSGVPTIFAVPIAAMVFCGLCVMILLGGRFVEAWRLSNDGQIGMLAPAAADAIVPAEVAAKVSDEEPRASRNDERGGPRRRTDRGSSTIPADSRRIVQLKPQLVDSRSDVQRDHRDEDPTFTLGPDETLGPDNSDTGRAALEAAVNGRGVDAEPRGLSRRPAEGHSSRTG